MKYIVKPTPKFRDTLNKGEAVDSAPRGCVFERCENRLIQRFLKKDLKLAEKRGYHISSLSDVVKILAEGEQLPPKYKDHELKGDYAGYRECHVEPDWLLVYKISEESLILYLMRTGTHSDLF